MQNLNQAPNKTLNLNNTLNLNETLQAKYPHLEISVLPLSKVQRDNESKRIDSEYFKREYLENEAIISRFECKTLEQLSTKITNGHTPYGENLLDNEVKFITAEFIDDFLINEVKKFISFESHSNYLKRSILNNGDIIFSIKGKVGNAVPIFDIKEPLNINQDVAKISLKKEINHFYVSAFLNSKYGKKQTEAQATGQINPFVALGVLKNLKIPILPKAFQLEIENLVQNSHKALKDSKTLYKEAENLLYEALGLNPTNPLSSLQNDTHPHPTGCEPSVAKTPSAREGEQEGDTLSPPPLRRGVWGVGKDSLNHSDIQRDFYLESQNFRILRFWNNEILENLEGVLNVIKEVLQDDNFANAKNTHPQTPSAREGALPLANPTLQSKGANFQKFITSKAKTTGKSPSLASENSHDKSPSLAEGVWGWVF